MRSAELAIIISYPTSASGIIIIPNNYCFLNNYCFIKNNQELLLDLADFAWKEQPEENLLVAIPWTWYNGSYTMAAKPIKSLELHYTMIQFLIICNSSVSYIR